MKVNKIERLAVGVPNLEQGIQQFSQMLGIEFQVHHEATLPSGSHIKFAISSQGLELVEVPGKDMGIRSFHFRVDDLAEARVWVEKNGGQVVDTISIGSFDEVIFNIFGLRIILVSYPGDDPIVAMKE